MLIAPKSEALFKSEGKENWFVITNTYVCSRKGTCFNSNISNNLCIWTTLLVCVNDMECGEFNLLECTSVTTAMTYVVYLSANMNIMMEAIETKQFNVQWII